MTMVTSLSFPACPVTYAPMLSSNAQTYLEQSSPNIKDLMSFCLIFIIFIYSYYAHGGPCGPWGLNLGLGGKYLNH